MENEELKEEIKKQTRIIKRLKRKIKKLEDDLYFKNNARPNNHKTRLRVKDIIKMYPVAKSTIWLYVKKEKLKAIKNSARVTTFDAKEVDKFFTSIGKGKSNLHKEKTAKTVLEDKIKQERLPLKTPKIK